MSWLASTLANLWCSLMRGKAGGAKIETSGPETEPKVPRGLSAVEDADGEPIAIEEESIASFSSACFVGCSATSIC